MRFLFNKIESEISIDFDFQRYSRLIEAVAPDVEPVEIPEIFERSQILYFKHFLEKHELSDDDKLILNSTIMEPIINYFDMTPEFFDRVKHIKYTFPIYSLKKEDFSEGCGYEHSIDYFTNPKLMKIAFRKTIYECDGSSYQIYFNDLKSQFIIGKIEHISAEDYLIKFMKDKVLISGWSEQERLYESKTKFSCKEVKILHELPDLEINPFILDKLNKYTLVKET
jgi:hypothetical protein